MESPLPVHFEYDVSKQVKYEPKQEKISVKKLLIQEAEIIFN